MTKLEQIQALANAGKAIEVATKSLQFACNTLLEVTKSMAKPEIHLVKRKNDENNLEEEGYIFSSSGACIRYCGRVANYGLFRHKRNAVNSYIGCSWHYLWLSLAENL